MGVGECVWTGLGTVLLFSAFLCFILSKVHCKVTQGLVLFLVVQTIVSVLNRFVKSYNKIIQISCTHVKSILDFKKRYTFTLFLDFYKSINYLKT